MSLLVLGTVALDTLKTPAGKRTDILGGSAAHFAMAARFFAKVNLAAVVGEDFPQKYIIFLQKKGIVLNSLKKIPGETSFRWAGEYKGDMNSAITLNTHLGVLPDFRPELTKQEKRMEYIFLANVDPDIQKYLLDSLPSPKLVALDTMNFWIKNKRRSLLKVLRKADIFFANDMEVKDLSGEQNLIKAASCLGRFGPKMIVIKKGEHGVLFCARNFMFSLPGYPVKKLVDPTGAGDSFAGGFMGYLAKVRRVSEKTIKRAIGYGAVIASFNVEGFGLERTARLTMSEINRRFNSYRKNLII